jgi:hypothetical protein
MGNRSTAIALLLLVALFFALQLPAYSEERFGPWKYFAPYYFPPDKCCMGHCFGPDDVFPRYETPPPPKPNYGGDCCNPSMPASMAPMPRKRPGASHARLQPMPGPRPVNINQQEPQAVSTPKPQTQNSAHAARRVSRPTPKQATTPMSPGATRFPSNGQNR